MPGQRTEENELFFPVIFLIISIASYVTLGVDWSEDQMFIVNNGLIEKPKSGSF